LFVRSERCGSQSGRDTAYATAMPSQTGDARSEILHEQIVPQFLAMLDDAPPLEDPAELEQLAATLLIPLQTPEVPAEVGFAVLDALAARRDANAAGALAALAVLAAEPLAARAREHAQRLASDGITATAADAVGMLAVEQAVRIPGEGTELVVALLTRPGTEDVQAVILGIEHPETGGALVECGLTPPAPISEARELMEGIDGAAPQPIDAGELAALTAAAARRAVELEVALGAAAGPALPIISRALTGDPAGLPRPLVLAPWGDEDPELVVDAAEAYQRVMEMLLDEFEQHARATQPPDGVVWQHGDFVASTMLQWKGGYDDGRLGHWTQADLAEYLLDYFPRKVSVDEATLSAVPDCVRAFLAFLRERGSLSGDPLEQLEQACEELRDEFQQAAGDSSHWGLAKSMVMQMQAEGIDPSAAGASDAWMADFNARPREQRDAIIGPAADRMARAAGFPTGGPRAPKQKAQRRKAQRQARKRNRRG
jgi:hypothetical protein